MSDAGEVIRKQYLYRRLILSRKLSVSAKGAARLIGPDCAYHLYRSHTTESRSKRGTRAGQQARGRARPAGSPAGNDPSHQAGRGV
jgi:hypothetical protein